MCALAAACERSPRTRGGDERSRAPQPQPQPPPPSPNLQALNVLAADIMTVLASGHGRDIFATDFMGSDPVTGIQPRTVAIMLVVRADGVPPASLTLLPGTPGSPVTLADVEENTTSLFGSDRPLDAGALTGRWRALTEAVQALEVLARTGRCAELPVAEHSPSPSLVIDVEGTRQKRDSLCAALAAGPAPSARVHEVLIGVLGDRDGQRGVLVGRLDQPADAGATTLSAFWILE